MKLLVRRSGERVRGVGGGYLGHDLVSTWGGIFDKHARTHGSADCSFNNSTASCWCLYSQVLMLIKPSRDHRNVYGAMPTKAISKTFAVARTEIILQ